MSATDITRIPNRKLPSKSAVATYHLPGGGGFLWAVAVSPDRTQDIRIQTLGALGVIDTYLRDAGLDRTRIVKAEIVVTDHDNKPAFEAIPRSRASRRLTLPALTAPWGAPLAAH